jgi:hypothetical protein
MKKKTIEKIPYLTLPANQKEAKYIGITAFKNIAHELHLFLEVYKNGENREVPVARIVLTKKDFGTYFPESDEWSQGNILTDGYYYSTGYRLVWENKIKNIDDTERVKKENVLNSEEDLHRIQKMCKDVVMGEREWWNYISEHQNDIVTDKRIKASNRKYERRQQALKDRQDHTPELPEEVILDLADRLYFSEKHFLYYKKRGSWADIACSECGGVSHGRWKSGISYESQFQKQIEEPREGLIGKCPLCGARGEYKCQGKVKGVHEKKIHIFLGQKYKESGMVIRYVEVSKEWVLEQISEEKGIEMSGAYEKLSGVEIARAYFEPDKKVQIDYYKHNNYTGKDFWDDCNLNGIANIEIRDGYVMRKTYENMSGTMFQYSAMKEYADYKSIFNPIEYLERYQQTPQIEMLVKMGIDGVVEKLLKCQYGIVANENGKTMNTFLGIRKQRVRQLKESRGDLDILKVMQMEYRMGAVWTDEQFAHLAELHLERGQIESAIEYMSLQQLLNRIEKYAGCEYGTGCSSAAHRLQSTATTYVDYLNMRRELGYDLSNMIYQYPRDLKDAHDRMVMESNQKEMDKRLKEVKEKFSGIRKQYRKLRKKYYYEDEEYIIRPARSAEEIVMEGRLLHHCVGGDTYLSRHDTGTSYILMLRFREDADNPYITVEIDASNDRIRQWYGAYDKKPDQKHMQEWIDQYVYRLQNNLLAADQPAVQGVMIPA